MRKSPSLIPNGGSLEAEAPDILPHIEEPAVEKDVVTMAEVNYTYALHNCLSPLLSVLHLLSAFLQTLRIMKASVLTCYVRTHLTAYSLVLQ